MDTLVAHPRVQHTLVINSGRNGRTLFVSWFRTLIACQWNLSINKIGDSWNLHKNMKSTSCVFPKSTLVGNMWIRLSASPNASAGSGKPCTTRSPTTNTKRTRRRSSTAGRPSSASTKPLAGTPSEVATAPASADGHGPGSAAAKEHSSGLSADTAHAPAVRGPRQYGHNIKTTYSLRPAPRTPELPLKTTSWQKSSSGKRPKTRSSF